MANNPADDVSFDGLILYCYDSTARRLRLTLLDSEGGDVARVDARTYDEKTLMGRRGRDAITIMLFTLLPFAP